MGRNTIIWTMTTIRHPTPHYREDGSSYHCRDSRTVGFMDSFEAAEELVLLNAMDMCEDGYYPYVVIEHFGQGVYPYVGTHLSSHYEQSWYLWNDKLSKYEKLSETPEEFERIVGWGLG